MNKVCDIKYDLSNTDIEVLIEALYTWHKKWCGYCDNENLDKELDKVLEGKSEEFYDGINEAFNFFDQVLFEDLMKQVDPEYGQ